MPDKLADFKAGVQQMLAHQGGDPFLDYVLRLVKVAELAAKSLDSHTDWTEADDELWRETLPLRNWEVSDDA